MAISPPPLSLSNVLQTPLNKPISIPNPHIFPIKTHLTFSSQFKPTHLKFASYFKSISFHPFNPSPKHHSLHHSHHNPIKSLFTGIVEEMGEIKQLGFAQTGGFEMKISAKTVLSDVKLGDSIAVNGTCLTVTEFDTESSHFTVGLSPETLRKTSLSELKPGSFVNLERALQPTTRMGGHFVQGHVDGTGEIVSLEVEGDSLWVKVRTSPELLKFIVPKGFIAVDGASLTVVRVFDEESCFNFMLVAYTQQKVVIPLKSVGQKLNLEVDILGKYVERLLSSGFSNSTGAL
ncbi:lumazine-binding family protein [Tasmannia lanceolata]|uniref:lumazine-binding family protein n=1 Tax=Tasmannia lanceolata TaxID=3420 RepID=UPI004062C3BF